MPVTTGLRHARLGRDPAVHHKWVDLETRLGVSPNTSIATTLMFSMVFMFASRNVVWPVAKILGRVSEGNV